MLTLLTLLKRPVQKVDQRQMQSSNCYSERKRLGLRVSWNLISGFPDLSDLDWSISVFHWGFTQNDYRLKSDCIKYVSTLCPVFWLLWRNLILFVLIFAMNQFILSLTFNEALAKFWLHASYRPITCLIYRMPQIWDSKFLLQKHPSGGEGLYIKPDFLSYIIFVTPWLSLHVVMTWRVF